MNNTNKRKHRCKEKLPPLNGGIDKRQITKKRIKNLNFQTKHATRQQACKAKMHRFDDLPTRTQLQTKVGAARKLPPLNGETETNNKKGCENSQPEFLQKKQYVKQSHCCVQNAPPRYFKRLSLSLRQMPKNRQKA